MNSSDIRRGSEVFWAELNFSNELVIFSAIVVQLYDGDAQVCYDAGPGRDGSVSIVDLTELFASPMEAVTDCLTKEEKKCLQKIEILKHLQAKAREAEPWKGDKLRVVVQPDDGACSTSAAMNSMCR